MAITANEAEKRCYTVKEIQWWRHQSGPGRFRTCTGGHGNRGIWPYH